MKRIAALIILSTFLLSACASTQWSRTPVAKEYDFIVTLEQQAPAETGRQHYAHPYVIDLAELEKLLGDLSYSENGDREKTAPQNPVFQAVEISRMAPVLAKALAKAEPGQRVRFASFNLGKAAMFSLSQKTEGVLFIESGGRLNLAFNFINASRSPSETSAVYHSYAKADPLKIRTAATTITATAPYAERHRLEAGGEAPMWVTADLAKLKEATEATALTVSEEPVTAAPGSAPGSRAPATPAEKAAAAQTTQDLRKADIKNNLKFLKELRDEQLISEQDYNAKKREVLDKLD